MESKLCRKCGETKCTSEFGIRSKNSPYIRAYCKECRRKDRKEWGVKNPDKVKHNDYKKYWKDPEKSRRLKREGMERAKQKDPEGIKMKKRKYYLDNKEEISEKSKQYRRKNPHVHKKAITKYNAKNPHISRATVVRRRALKLKATLGREEDWKSFERDIQKECVKLENETGVRHSLDHIIPLVGKSHFEGKYQQVVCGLHVPWNMQILTFSENARKNSKFDGTYENESWRILDAQSN